MSIPAEAFGVGQRWREGGTGQRNGGSVGGSGLEWDKDGSRCCNQILAPAVLSTGYQDFLTLRSPAASLDPKDSGAISALL